MRYYTSTCITLTVSVIWLTNADIRREKTYEKRREEEPCYKPSNKRYHRKTYARQWEYAGFEASLPLEWDWRNVNGVNYISPVRNQHLPVYCGACWVFGATAALEDRFNVARKARWPFVQLSQQEIIDCAKKGNCQGGEGGDVFEYAHKRGLVDEGCNVYRATNGACNKFNRCGTCWPDSCFPVTNYTHFYVKDYGHVSGREKIMAEVYFRGPIVCSMACTGQFDFNYTTGIYRQKTNASANHLVSITGWAIDKHTGIEYWIVRNSWGEAWGEKGFFRIVTSKYDGGRGNEWNMGIEADCLYADPDMNRSNLPQH